MATARSRFTRWRSASSTTRTTISCSTCGRASIGLRTIVLDRHDDEYGESFQFVVNGQPIFAKGANWIPAHCFVAGLKRADYDELLTDATEAHMNMIRVWGGGIYESEDFYDLCDEKGLLVWQDFMFACALYRGDDEFLALVETEAEYQVQRLAHRACLALWCGNNELEQREQDILATKARTDAYEDIFYDLLPGVVEGIRRHDGLLAQFTAQPRGLEEGPQQRERRGQPFLGRVARA